MTCSLRAKACNAHRGNRCCPVCGELFVPEVKVCPHCDVSLVNRARTEATALDRKEGVSCRSRLVPIFIGPALYANRYQTILQSLGVSCFLDTENKSMLRLFKWLPHPARLLVAAPYLDRARAILRGE